MKLYTITQGKNIWQIYQTTDKLQYILNNNEGYMGVFVELEDAFKFMVEQIEKK